MVRTDSLRGLVAKLRGESDAFCHRYADELESLINAGPDQACVPGGGAVVPTPMKLTEHGAEVCAYRMDAYYYGFSCTGINAIDLILSAVACAGKARHHTEDWGDGDYGPYHNLLRGNSPVEWIQNAANDAAQLLSAAPAAPVAEAREIDAAAPGGAQEPVAEVTHVTADNYGHRRRIRWLTDEVIPAGTKLYTTPHQPTEAARDREDTERLQFLIANEFSVRRLTDTGRFVLLSGSGHLVSVADFNTPMEAIDAARAAGGGGP